jgi:hypothetical protein
LISSRSIAASLELGFCRRYERWRQIQQARSCAFTLPSAASNKPRKPSVHHAESDSLHAGRGKTLIAHAFIQPDASAVKSRIVDCARLV